MLLNAVMCVWNEEDIIYSTVKHAFAQGCLNVYIVDNGSSDKTIEKAKAAGATHFLTFRSKYFDEVKKVMNLNDSVEAINKSLSDQSVWWLYIDADEFPSIDTSITIIEFLKGIDADCRAVHGFMYDHIPTHAPYMEHGNHPADFMPICKKTNTSKIPLLRQDKDKKYIFSLGGAHTFHSLDEVHILHDRLLIHHFPYRKPEDTHKRLAGLSQKKSDGSSRLDWMDNYSKEFHGKQHSMYRDRLAGLEKFYTENKFRNFITDSLIYDYKKLVRWYDPLLLYLKYDAISEVNDVDFHIWKATHFFFMEQYELALCSFNDALLKARDNDIQEYLMLGMARCFLAMSDVESCLNSLRMARRSYSSEICKSATFLMEKALSL